MTLNELIDRLEMFRDVQGGQTDVKVLNYDTGEPSDPALSLEGSFRTGFFLGIREA